VHPARYVVPYLELKQAFSSRQMSPAWQQWIWPKTQLPQAMKFLLASFLDA
jgi:hypothetical protein